MLNKNSQRKKKRQPRSNTESELSFSSVFSASVKGAGISLGLLAILSALLCFVAYLTDDPTSLVSPLSLLALYICSFFSGFISLRSCGHSSLVCGLISGGIFMSFLIFLSFFFSSVLSSHYSFGVSLLLHALIVIFAIFGGYAGQKKPKRSHRPKR